MEKVLLLKQMEMAQALNGRLRVMTQRLEENVCDY